MARQATITAAEIATAPARPVGRRIAGRLGESRMALAGVAALTALALVLRAALIRDSLMGDELFLFRIVHDRSLGDALHMVRETEKTPPLLFLLAWAAARLGDPTVWSRLPSLVLGTAMVPVAYALGVRTVGRAAGLLAAAIVALQPFAIFYATENRAYAAVAFFAGLSTLCLWSALQTGRRRWWAGYVVAVLAVLYTHYTGVFVVLAQAAWALWAHRERVRQIVVAHGLIVLGYVAWIPSYLVQQAHSADEARRIAALAPPSLKYFAKINAQALLGAPFVPLRTLPGTVWLVVGLGAIAVAAIAAIARSARGPRPRFDARSPRVLLVLLAVATPAGVAILSLRPHMSFMLPRNLSASLIPAALVVSWLLLSLRPRAAVPAVAAVLLALGVGAVKAHDLDNRRSPYRDAARFIDARARPGDPVVEHFFLQDRGPLADVLAVNFRHPHPLFRRGDEHDEAWARGRKTGRVFVVLPLPVPLKHVPHLPQRSGPGERFTRVAERRYTGLEDILVGEYALRRR